jgi:uncharacterized protein involved in tolerance to divalent cations
VNLPEIAEVEITAPDAAWCESFARQLLEQGLVASATIIPGALSLYLWEGDLREHSEAILRLRTQPDLVDDIRQRCDLFHPYELPGFRVHIVGTTPAYHAWVEDPTGGRPHPDGY